MLCDMVCRGAFHHHIMTTGGNRATPVRAVQTTNEFALPAIPVMVTADTQSAALNNVIDLRCIRSV